MKQNDDWSLKLKPRIAPRRNENNLRGELSSASAVCSPAGLRTVESIAPIKLWKLHKADVKSSFVADDWQRQIYMFVH